MSVMQPNFRKRKRKAGDGFGATLKNPASSAVDEIGSGDAAASSSSFPDQPTPTDVNVVAFAEKRSREIRTLLGVLSTRSTNKRLFQQLPRHMRRRAMSHNIKRLPKALRIHAEKETSNTKKPHRPRKKYRKRPKNKKLAYAKRQLVNKWLETHVWHAKRFHMITKWGYKLANYPNDKGFRAAFRASAEHCLMTDMSYLVCVQLVGPEASLLAGLRKLTAGDTGRTFAYKDYLAGHLEGSCLIYKEGEYPSGALGVVRFLFAPVSPSLPVDRNRELFIWIHPSATSDIISSFILAFKLQPDGSNSSPPEVSEIQLEISAASEIKSGTVGAPEIIRAHESEVVSPSENPSMGMEVQESAEVSECKFGSGACFRSEGTTLVVLQDQFVRLRLTGPKSTIALKETLKPAVIDRPGDSNGQWWKDFFGDESRAQLHRKQSDVWSEMDNFPTPVDISPGSVLGVTVRDPRIFLPRKKSPIPHEPERAEPISNGSSFRLPDRTQCLSSSPIWDENVRAAVRKEKISDHEMNKLRSALPAPGLELDMGDKEARIPIVLVRNGGYQQHEQLSKIEYGAGWELILPAGWGASFWISLVYNGARVGGQRELDTVSLHAAKLKFPEDFPDTPAGTTAAKVTREELEVKFQRYPPNKRPNYIKTGALSPFHAPWSALIENWKNRAATEDVSKVDGFHVIWNIRILLLVRDLLSGNASLGNFTEEQQTLLHRHSTGLIPVHLDFQNGGTSKQFSLICIPSMEDLAEKRKKSGYTGPVEPKHADPFKKNPVKLRRKLQIEKILSEPEHVVEGCSRSCLGFVTKPGYSFIKGRETAIGFCALLGILELMKVTPPGTASSVLVRSLHTFQYHFVKMSAVISAPSI